MKSPLRVALPLGIGDCHWVATKLRALSKYHDGRPIHAYVSRSPNHASIGFLRILPMIDQAIASGRAVYDQPRDLGGDHRAERWSTLEGCRGWRGFDYVLVANGHLESGRPLRTWLPELRTEYSYEFKIDPSDRAAADRIAPERPVLLYPSGVGANLGFHGNTWTVRHWVEVIDRLNGRGITPVLVGSGSQSDLAYRSMLVRAARGRSFLDIIGKTSIPQAIALIERAAVWCGLNSGLGIVAAMRRVPTVMLWADARYPIRGTGAWMMHPAMQRSWLSAKQLETYRTLSYGSPQISPASVVRHVLGIARVPAREAA